MSKIVQIFLRYLLISIFSLFLLIGCSNFAIKKQYEEKQKTELTIIDLKKQHEIETLLKVKEAEQAKDLYIIQLKENFQQTANWIYGAFIASNLKGVKDRLDNIINLRIKTGLSYSPGPTPEAIIEQNRLLQEELNEAKVTNEELSTRYSAKEKEANLAREAEKKLGLEIEQKKKELEEIHVKFNQQISDAQSRLNKINDELIAANARLADDNKRKEALQRLQIYIFTGLGVICGILAAFLKTRTIELALGGAGFLALAIAVPFITQLMINIAAAIVFIVIGVMIYRKYFIEKALADRSIGSIQEIRNNSETRYKQKFKAILQDWFKDAPDLHKKVEKRLVELNLK
jgi:hypothetical protein